MAKLDLLQRIAFVDIETTGARAQFDRVIEVGIIRVEKTDVFQVVNTYQSLIYPGQHVPEEIFKLTGITGAELESAPYFRQIRDDILEILDDCVFVAHNVRFDYGFLKHEFARLNTDFSPKQICSVKLSRALFPEFRHHNLDALIERFGIECQSRHRAYDDAKAVWIFFQKALDKFGEPLINDVLHRMMKRPALPGKLDSKLIEALPQRPGVYIFYDDKGAVLYVGKSKNIKDRVLSHFSADIRSSKEMAMAAQVSSIETKVCAGELGALILESNLIKELNPIYNRMLRFKQQLVVLKAKKDKDGYFTAELSMSVNIDPNYLDDIFAVFKSTKIAKESLRNIAKEYNLCLKKLQLESTKSGCFGYRLEQCKGACLNKESPMQYNLRFLTAFLKLKFRDWPFNGPVVITERTDKEEFEQFLIDKWCFLGSFKNGVPINEVNTHSPVNFDLDVYKIINNYLKSPSNLKNVKVLKSPDEVYKQA